MNNPGYGLYLWHFPILGCVWEMGGVWGAVLYFGLSFAFAALSLAFVERPFRSAGKGTGVAGNTGEPDRPVSKPIGRQQAA
jgi:peptidoglycan/LPS O-acetylase OafA/YrhL